MQGLFLCVVVIFISFSPSDTTKCGFCEPATSISPEVACKTTKLSTCPVSYTSSCGLWGRRCTRYKLQSCNITESSCCRGILLFGNCIVSGCGGCTDTTVYNQPPCYKSSSTYKIETYTYYSSCGWWGRKCSRQAYRIRMETKQVPHCCSGFRLCGSRCIRKKNDIFSVDFSSKDSVPVDSLPIGCLSIDTQPVDSLPGDSKPVDSLPVTSLPVDSLPGDSKPVDSTPGDRQPEDNLPGDSKPVDSLPVDSLHEETTKNV